MPLHVHVHACLPECVHARLSTVLSGLGFVVCVCVCVCVFSFGNSRPSVFLYASYTRGQQYLLQSCHNYVNTNRHLFVVFPLSPSLSCVFRLYHPRCPLLFFLSSQYSEIVNYLIAISRHVARRRCCG